MLQFPYESFREVYVERSLSVQGKKIGIYGKILILMERKGEEPGYPLEPDSNADIITSSSFREMLRHPGSLLWAAGVITLARLMLWAEGCPKPQKLPKNT
ncbi:MAG: hypothetical protein PHV63_03450 [Candidatus Daviesbacteria bacterium]|nr:hypothetical protein [Candidatus Daviesbacteria bacterium]